MVENQNTEEPKVEEQQPEQLYVYLLNRQKGKR